MIGYLALLLSALGTSLAVQKKPAEPPPPDPLYRMTDPPWRELTAEDFKYLDTGSVIFDGEHDIEFKITPKTLPADGIRIGLCTEFMK